ncbi:MAG: hypothetical protein KBC46_03485 [Ferrovibrio sp.]|nr:hypothetical protein [Ferrovibrio sp.]
MSDSNRTRIAGVRETTIGTTPNTPRLRGITFVGESLSSRPDTVKSDTVRADRMNEDALDVGETNAGGLTFELQYPVDKSMIAEIFASALQADWVSSPSRDNDGVADSVISDVAATGGVITVTNATAFVVGHLVRNTGFGVSANNGLFRCTTGSATAPAFASQSLANEAAPSAAARMKVVGFEGASGDITATADGLGSTTLNFTTLGLQVGQWIKIGGSGAGYRLATEACNGWARVSAIGAQALTLDNKPAGWTTDDGSGKTLRVFFGDQLKNGTTQIGLTFERGFLSQQTPTYIVQRGMEVNSLRLPIQAKQTVKLQVEFMGMSSSQGTSTLDASIDPAPATVDYPIMAGSANVNNISEAGAAISGGNYARELQFEIANNLRDRPVADSKYTSGHGVGSSDVKVTLTTYFASNALLQKLFNRTPTSVSSRLTKGGRAVITEVPRAIYMTGSPNAGGRNQDVMLPLELEASIDPLTQAQFIVNRLEYYEP